MLVNTLVGLGYLFRTCALVAMDEPMVTNFVPQASSGYCYRYSGVMRYLEWSAVADVRVGANRVRTMPHATCRIETGKMVMYPVLRGTAFSGLAVNTVGLVGFAARYGEWKFRVGCCVAMVCCIRTRTPIAVSWR
jgi:hypothetical protein